MEQRSKSTPLGVRVWVSILLFGFVGQIAWIVENMNFAALAQDICANAGNKPMGYIVTTWMVICSAIVATVTTIFAGGLCDRVGKRKPFIAFGYILWGVTIMGFALIPMRPSLDTLAWIAFVLVAFDCIMTLVGSTANDAAFNAWVADVTDSTNRGRVNAILSMLPVFAVVVVMIGLGGLYHSDAESNWVFFLVLGAIPMAAGVLALLLLKDAPRLNKATDEHYRKQTFYGFRPAVIRENKMLYVCLSAACIVGVSQQTFFSYLINFVQNTRGYGDGFAIPVAIIILGAAALTGLSGFLSDRLGRKRFLFPLLILAVLGVASFYCLQFLGGSAGDVVLYVGGVVMMGGLLSLTGTLNATFQDYIPKGFEGRFQGVRMCFTVLIPMIVGPIISLIIGLNTEVTAAEGFAPDYGMFLAAAIVALLGFVPLYFVRRDAARLRADKCGARSDAQ